MGITIIQSGPHKARRSGHTLPKAYPSTLDQPGRVRIAHFQCFLGGISHSALYVRIARGLIPKPDGRDPRPYWRTETVRKFLEK